MLECISSLIQRTEGMDGAGLSVWRHLCAEESVSAPKNGRTSPAEGRFAGMAFVPSADYRGVKDEGRWTCSSRECQGTSMPQAVLTLGTGTADNRSVTRDKSALTGQELGRWRRIRSLYCLTCTATLKRVSITVEGWAWASAVCCKVCVRKAWCRA